MALQYPISYQYQSYWKEKKQFIRNTDKMNFWLMLAVEGGQFWYQIDDKEGIAASGDVVICPANLLFHRRIIEPLTFHYAIFKYQNPDDAGQGHITAALRDLFEFKFVPSEKDRLFNNFRHLYLLSFREDAHAVLWKNHLLNDIWFLLTIDIEELQNTSGLGQDPLMKKAKQWIEAKADGNVIMKDIARSLRLHPVQFTRRFQNVFGMNPYQYLTVIRMEKAKSLLMHTDFTIDHIARNCGYSNGFYFSRMFTKYTKMNPSEYRRIHTVPSP